MEPIFQLKKQSNDLFLIVLTALGFALGINLISSYIGAQIKTDWYLLVLGLIFIAIPLLLIKKILLGNSIQIFRLRGALHFVEKDGAVVKSEIHGYNFNRDVNEYLSSFLNENAAYKKTFMASMKREVKSKYKYDPAQLDFYNIINSVLELVFLKQLDYHLNSYFVHNEIDTSGIKAVSRNELDQGVLKNRVIDLITKDIKEREAFVSENDRDTSRVVYKTGKNGIVYHRLELELPPESSIHRNSSGFLEIDNKLFRITFKPNFTGFSTFIPSELYEHSGNNSPYLIDVKLEITIKNSLIISDKNLEIYQWLDSFIRRFEEYVSTDCLVARSNLEIVRLLKSRGYTGAASQ